MTTPAGVLDGPRPLREARSAALRLVRTGLRALCRWVTGLRVAGRARHEWAHDDQARGRRAGAGREDPSRAQLGRAAADLLELGQHTVTAFQEQPYRAEGPVVPTDPMIKELIHEEFGDGIMSAIKLRLDVTRRADPGGDRVVVTFDGKFLDYQW